MRTMMRTMAVRQRTTVKQADRVLRRLDPRKVIQWVAEEARRFRQEFEDALRPLRDRFPPPPDDPRLEDALIFILLSPLAVFAVAVLLRYWFAP